MSDHLPRLELLGGVELRGLDGKSTRSILTQPKLVALLVYLVLAPQSRRHQRRDQLVGLLWPDLDQAHARNALRKSIHAIRAAFGGDFILSRGDEEVALADGRLTCDVASFVDASDEGRFADAIKLYRGDLMPGFHVGGCTEFARWLDEVRADARERAAASALAHAEQLAGDDEQTIAGKLARRATRLAADDERVLRRALQLLIRVGDRAGALRLFDDFAQRLQQEFDAEPSPETRAVAQGLRSEGGA
jgi:DNA-binding SARP family transcriptional activator